MRRLGQMRAVLPGNFALVTRKDAVDCVGGNLGRVAPCWHEVLRKAASLRALIGCVVNSNPPNSKGA